MRRLVNKGLRGLALSRGKAANWWRRLGTPTGLEWAEYLRRHGGFAQFGSNCSVNPATVFTDPYLTFIGSNVRIAGGHFFGHDGAVNMVNRALGTKYDSVAPIELMDDVFIGYGAVILPGVTVGTRAIVGAGAVVARSIPSNSVAVGNPARVVSTFDEYVLRLSARNAGYPWRDLIEHRDAEFDPQIELELRRMRQSHFTLGKKASG